MAFLEKCCGCINLRIGVITIALVQAFVSIILLTLTILDVYPREILRLANVKLISLNTIYTIGLSLMHSAFFVSCILLLIGVRQVL